MHTLFINQLPFAAAQKSAALRAAGRLSENRLLVRAVSGLQPFFGRFGKAMRESGGETAGKTGVKRAALSWCRELSDSLWFLIYLRLLCLLYS